MGFEFMRHKNNERPKNYITKNKVKYQVSKNAVTAREEKNHKDVKVSQNYGMNKEDNHKEQNICDITSPTFTTGLSQGSNFVAVLNSYPNGVSVSIHRPQDLRGLPSFESLDRIHQYDPFFLRTRDTRELGLPEGRFFVYRDSYRENLEKFFSTLKKKNILDTLTVYFGVTNDPFHGFHKKFEQTAACLEILEKYKPARVVIQSRSRMLLTCLPTLKMFGDSIFCVIPFETRLEKAISRYTPGQPRLEERLITAAGLRAQGIKITFCVSPLLPYGETSGDAWKFGEVLVRYSDNILIQSLCNGTRENELTLSKMAISQKLEADQQMIFLRPNVDSQLRAVIEKLSPSHLQIPELKQASKDLQLKLFAA